MYNKLELQRKSSTNAYRVDLVQQLHSPRVGENNQKIYKYIEEPDEKIRLKIDAGRHTFKKIEKMFHFSIAFFWRYGIMLIVRDAHPYEYLLSL